MTAPISAAQVRALFREKGLPLTDQRLAVFEELASRRDHPGAEEIFAALKPRHPQMSPATVYKALQALQDLGAVSRVDSPGGRGRYDAITATHHHAVCTACGRIEDVFDPRLDALAASVPRGFRPRGHSVHFHGLCAACAGGPVETNAMSQQEENRDG